MQYNIMHSLTRIEQQFVEMDEAFARHRVLKKVYKYIKRDLDSMPNHYIPGLELALTTVKTVMDKNQADQTKPLPTLDKLEQPGKLQLPQVAGKRAGCLD